MGKEGLSLPTTPKGWAIHLTKLVCAVQRAQSLPRFPVDVEAIARDYSRQVFPNEPVTMVEGLDLSKGIEGMLMPNPRGTGEWGIIYNQAIKSKGRRNFTLARELGTTSSTVMLTLLVFNARTAIWRTGAPAGT